MQNEYTQRQRQIDTAKMLLALAWILIGEVFVYYFCPVSF
jgi:hypothetical protein